MTTLAGKAASAVVTTVILQGLNEILYPYYTDDQVQALIDRSTGMVKKGTGL